MWELLIWYIQTCVNEVSFEANPKSICYAIATNLSQKFSGMNGKYLAILFVKLLCQPTLSLYQWLSEYVRILYRHSVNSKHLHSTDTIYSKFRDKYVKEYVCLLHGKLYVSNPVTLLAMNLSLLGTISQVYFSTKNVIVTQSNLEYNVWHE